ncbi:helix-turn-helix domain-containing protein [Streptomyces alkaliphilus]|uniref:Helix-turn-helix domain-containing protein n=1 Tax=Streptomyces alkaliphilus TaxID=1472722 RepID=A0A7W3TDJ8_9ACTN|nr:helix-turn-helix domain-containing protein [Streptomyces alkaliphilus]MBB0244893.1 helix-turn-helix domain-containing protein [Streptomyces alkaliphilus]
MDSTHPVWRSAAMREALIRHDAGAIVRLARRAADITLADLGGRVGYTAASLSRMERGEQPLRDVVLLRRLAECLDIPPHLLGLTAQPQQLPSNPPPTTRVDPQALFGEEVDDPVRRRELLAALAGAGTGTVLGASSATGAPSQPNLSGLEDPLLHRGPGQVPATDPGPATVAAAVDASRDEFGACRYTALARALPSRIALATTLDGNAHPERAATAVADLYTIATRLCIKLGEDGLAAVTADRALTAALGGADALTVAEAHRMVSSTWRRRGHHARATDVAVVAAGHLAGEPDGATVEGLSVRGNLYATAAYTAAKQGDRHTAQALIAEAEATAGQLGRDAMARGTVFGPARVLLHRISISHLLGDAGQAIEHARRVDVAALPTAERRARYWIDVARAFEQWGKPDRCHRSLLAAEQAAPQEVRRAPVRTMAAGLMRYDRTLPGVRTFARRVGALA